MIQSTLRTVAHCEDCSRGYFVPDPERTYGCKACGGLVRVGSIPPERASRPRGMVMCCDCQFLNPLDAEVCAECQAPLEGAEEVESEEEAVDLLHEAKQAFRRANPWGRGIAMTFHLGALAYGIATLFAVLALRRPDVPLASGILVVVLTTLLSVTMGTAALHLLFQPFLWTLAIALLATAVTIVHATGPNPMGFAVFASAAWALLSWSLLPAAKKFRDLIRHHKDLYILHHASQKTRRSLKGRTPGERHLQLMRAMRRADQRAWKVSGVAACVLIAASSAGTYWVVNHGRPQPFDEAVAEFEAAWNSDRSESLASLFDPRVRTAETQTLAAKRAGYDWVERLPRVTDGRPRGQKPVRQVDYDLDGVPLSATFHFDGLRWSLTAIDLPYPSVEPTLERFRAAWHASDPAALAGFFSSENRAEREATLARSKARRGWTVFPAILDTAVQSDGDGRANATFTLEEDKIVTKWFFREDGQWGLYGLEMPKIRKRSTAGAPDK